MRLVCIVQSKCNRINDYNIKNGSSLDCVRCEKEQTTHCINIKVIYRNIFQIIWDLSTKILLIKMIILSLFALLSDFALTLYRVWRYYIISRCWVRSSERHNTPIPLKLYTFHSKFVRNIQMIIFIEKCSHLSFWLYFMEELHQFNVKTNNLIENILMSHKYDLKWKKN